MRSFGSKSLFLLVALFALLLAGCGASHEHSLIKLEGQDPTCAEEGWCYYACSTCSDYTVHETLPALGHEYTLGQPVDADSHLVSCTRCAAQLEEPHTWHKEEMVKAPICGSSGQQLYRCHTCGQEKTEEIPSAESHVKGTEWVTTLPATELSAGKEVLYCTRCQQIAEERRIPALIEAEMPVLYFEGDYTAATNDKNEVPMRAYYVDPRGTEFSSHALIKVQGATSTLFPKKNYTVKLYKDAECASKFKVDLGWGKESKYCLKANWIDYTQARNIISCRLWGEMVDSRPESPLQERLSGLPNGGAIDGFPIAIYMNGEFHGLYTLNIPKDKWMFDMGDLTTEALLSAEDWVNTNFSVLMGDFSLNKNGDYVANNGGWEIKHFGTEKTDGSTDWITESFNRLILFCQENQGAAFREGIGQHLDVDAAIDYLLLCYTVYMRDNTSKNILWATYDGNVWFPSVYDQDATFGMVWDGKHFAPATECLPYFRNNAIVTGLGDFLLWDRLWNAFPERILQRYQALRKTILTEEHIVAAFEEFRGCIPDDVYHADCEAWEAEREAWWAEAPDSGESEWFERFDWNYTYGWVSERLQNLDAAMQKLSDSLGEML